jgi:UDP-3-O-[3-hydroxymyristoyl] glucosamine N-acyltransferase
MRFFVEIIAERLHGELQGDPKRIIEGVAPIEKAGEKDISFLADPKFLEAAKNSRAACILAPDTAKKELESFKNCVIYVKNPRYAFMLLLREAEKAMRPIHPVGIDNKAAVSPAAIIGHRAHVGPCCTVEAGAEIGPGAIIEAGCYIGHNVKIGARTRLYPGVKIMNSCSVGEDCILFPGVVIGSDGFGYVFNNGVHEKIPQIGRVIIGNKVEIGANTCIDRAAMETTRIGDGTKIDNLVHIAHNVQIGKGCIILAHSTIAGSVVLEDYVTLSGQSCVADHVRIGAGATLMGKSGVMSDVKPGALLCGFFAKPRAEAFKIEVLKGKLPEMYKELRKMKKIIEKLCPEEAAALEKTTDRGQKPALPARPPEKPPVPLKTETENIETKPSVYSPENK